MCFFKKKNKGEKPSKFIIFSKFLPKDKFYSVSGFKEGYNEGPRLVIPAFYKGKPVTGIDYHTKLPKEVETVVIPDTFEYVSPSTFKTVKRFEVSPTHPKYACVNGLLTSKDGKTLLAFPGGLGNLTKNLLEGTSIVAFKPDAWHGITNLKFIEVPKNIHIEGEPFGWLLENPFFESFIFDKDDPTWGFEDGMLYLKAGLTPTYKLVVNPTKKVVFKSSVATRVFLDHIHEQGKNYYNGVPSHNRRSLVETMVFEEGITEIDGDVGIYPRLREVYLPASLEKLSVNFFTRAKEIYIYYPGNKAQLLSHVEKAVGREYQSWNYINKCKPSLLVSNRLDWVK